MTQLTRAQMEALDKLFNTFAVADQREYYRSRINLFRRSGQQVNFIRAAFAFVGGIAAAMAGLVVQSVFLSDGRCMASPVLAAEQSYCTVMNLCVAILTILAIVAPAISGAFNTLADLYQWDRLVTIYDSASRNLAVADARSPDPEMDDLTYRASLNAFGDGSLRVMTDESAQWGQLVRTPEQIEAFLEAAREKVMQNQAAYTGGMMASISGSAASGGGPTPLPGSGAGASTSGSARRSGSTLSGLSSSPGSDLSSGTLPGIPSGRASSASGSSPDSGSVPWSTDLPASGSGAGSSLSSARRASPPARIIPPADLPDDRPDDLPGLAGSAGPAGTGSSGVPWTNDDPASGSPPQG